MRDKMQSIVEDCSVVAPLSRRIGRWRRRRRALRKRNDSEMRHYGRVLSRNDRWELRQWKCIAADIKGFLGEVRDECNRLDISLPSLEGGG